mmetsp:Transcript_36086/g.60089  ORF Transcript_36086/g.60089 Transcript_36086/m.60089 type:complete len:272 (-) Transcript_36086:239-1054(-)
MKMMTMSSNGSIAMDHSFGGLQKSRSQQGRLFIRKWRSPELLEEADYIFKRGIEQFPDNAFVQICYAQFVMLYKHNTGCAMAELKQAWESETTIATRFWLSSIRRNWERMNRSEVLGGSNKMSAVQMLEFKHLYAAAQQSHGESINQLRLFWHSLAKKNVGAAGALDQLPTQLEAIHRHSKAASAAYLELLKKSGCSKMLLRSYGAFLDSFPLCPFQTILRSKSDDKTLQVYSFRKRSCDQLLKRRTGPVMRKSFKPVFSRVVTVCVAWLF